MTTRSARHAVLSETATFDERTGELRVVIETPKGSRNKYDYNTDCDCLELATVLPEGMSFPYDFGFVPVNARRGRRSVGYPRLDGCSSRTGVLDPRPPGRCDRSQTEKQGRGLAKERSAN